jgi:hypothetical protein
MDGRLSRETHPCRFVREWQCDGGCYEGDCLEQRPAAGIFFAGPGALGSAGRPTVTAGVASARGRTVQAPVNGPNGGRSLHDAAQTDAAINRTS